MTLPDNEKKLDKKEKPLTKVIIRRLPPTMDQETFLSQVSPIPDYNYIYTVKGDSSLGEYAFSRVYINFTNPEDIFSFKERFDNYVFLDSRGHEYPAVVEFASFQKIPKKRGKIRMDPKCGTIETDPVYIEFVESLNKPQEPDEKPEFTLQLTNENKNDVTTPLLEYIKNKRAQRMRIREVRREERKRREFDRKKERYDDRRRPNEEKSPAKASNTKPHPNTAKDEKEDAEAGNENKSEEKHEKVFEKSSSAYYKNRDRKFEERRKDIKPRFPKKEYSDNRDYKEKDYRSKYDDYKKEPETKSYTKKVKKYSEKREERKMEAQKAEQKKLEQAQVKESKAEKDEAKSTQENKHNVEATSSCSNTSTKAKPEEKEQKHTSKEAESQKRIRNKDRPTIAIYRPGMLSKRKQNDGETSEPKEGKNDSKN